MLKTEEVIAVRTQMIKVLEELKNLAVLLGIDSVEEMRRAHELREKGAKLN